MGRCQSGCRIETWLGLKVDPCPGRGDERQLVGVALLTFKDCVELWYGLITGLAVFGSGERVLVEVLVCFVVPDEGGALGVDW